MTVQYQLSAISDQSSVRKAESRQLKSESSKKGFTLIELMVAISIVAILAAVGVVMYSSAQKSGRVSKRIQDLQAIQTAVELFKASKGAYPNLPTGGTVGTHVCVTSLSGNNVLSPAFMAVIPTDPANSTWCYQYTSNGTVGGATPDATEYKIRTYTSISSDMTSADFLQQTSLIDPARDGTAAGCSVETAGTITGWALYSGSTACGWASP